MLEIRNLTLQLGDPETEPALLSDAGIRFPSGKHFAAILGPSGSGKSTLLRIIAGLREPTDGSVFWEGRDLAHEGDFAPHEVGYVPQFSIAFDRLTVGESVVDALNLRMAGQTAEQRQEWVQQVLRDVGLDEIADRAVGVLSGGQRRRLALALELVSSPRLLLCDEVTSGLDPKAEDEISHLLHQISRTKDRLVINVTHSLRHLELYDSVVVLHQGHVVYHGSPQFLFHYFQVEKHEDLFPRLATRRAVDWHQSWLKHRDAYYEQSGFAVPPAEHVGPVLDIPPVTHADGGTPSAPAQLHVLITRRWRLFFRDRGQLALQLALLLGFPGLVVIFALGGLPQLQSLAAPSTGGLLHQVQAEFAQRAEMIRTGGLVSGLVMFQVILLALAGANNAAREIAGERLIFEKEKFAGLSPSAYVLSKVLFLGVLVVAQSVWMAVFVNWIVRFPGALDAQILILLLLNGAVTAVSLAISSWMRSAEQASLVSIYLVGFQLPLSGAVLAMPEALDRVTRWSIAAYWGWSGYLQTFSETRFYVAVQQVTQTPLSPYALCTWVLAAHIIVAIYLAAVGCRNARWD